MSKAEVLPVKEGELAELPMSMPITPMGMLQIAVEQNADLDKISKLMDLQERWEANKAKKAYVSAMAKFRSGCPAISKTRQAHNSNYAGLADTIDVIKMLMTECGLSHSWRTNQTDGGTTTVTCVVTHVDGHSEETSLMAAPDTSGSKNSIQAIGSTVSYLQRYTMFSILGLASSDPDDDGKATADDGLSLHRHEVGEALKESFSSDGPAIAVWLKENKLGRVRTASKEQLMAIEKAMK